MNVMSNIYTCICIIIINAKQNDNLFYIYLLFIIYIRTRTAHVYESYDVFILILFYIIDSMNVYVIMYILVQMYNFKKLLNIIVYLKIIK